MNKTTIAAAVVVAIGAAFVVALMVRAQRNGETRRAAIDEQTVVMFGDSITEQGDWDRLLPGYQTSNRGYSGYTTEQLVPLAADLASHQPLAVYLLAGTNDIRDGLPVSLTAEHLGTIVTVFAQSSPNTRIVLQTITPRADATEQVAAANAALAELAEDRGVELLDIHTPLDDGAGGLRPAETTDGLHLSDAGYHRWAGALIADLRSAARADS